jgi:SnoaL-like domain
LQNLADEAAVRRLIARIANSLDLKEWDEVAACLADSVYTDYSERLSSPPQSMLKPEFIASHRAELAPLRTHHQTGNVEVFINGTSATARLSALVFERDEGGRTTQRHCVYLLGFQYLYEAWAICSIVQKVLWTEADDSRA